MKARLYKQKFIHCVRFLHELNMSFMTWIKNQGDEPRVWPLKSGANAMPCREEEETERLRDVGVLA